MTRSELSGAIVRMRTRDEYDGMLREGLRDGGQWRDAGGEAQTNSVPSPPRHTLHCFKKEELEIVKS